MVGRYYVPWSMRQKPSEPMTIEPIGIALAPGDALLVNMVTNYLGALEGIGLLDALEKKWFEDGGWLIQLP